jgi:hypothetical protein
MPRTITPEDSYAAMGEAEVRRIVVDYAHKLGWLVFSMPIAKTRRPVKDATGYPDLTLARDGEVRWFELKTEHGEVSPFQGVWLKILPNAHVIRPSDLLNGRLRELLQ